MLPHLRARFGRRLWRIKVHWDRDSHASFGERIAMTARRTKGSAASLATVPANVRDRYLFCREGEYWTIVYEGTLFRAAGGCTSAGTVSGERARVAVTKRIKASLTKIATLDPALAYHLSTRIKTGYLCVYLCDPRGPLSWKF